MTGVAHHPFASIVIPTRERAFYLRRSIETCLAIPDGDIEILVLDNDSRDDTMQVVQSFTDARLRYIRSSRRLSMRDNFERGLKEARGEWLGFIGDDDGVLPFAIAELKTIAARYKVEAVSAARAHYFWPDLLSRRRGTALLPRRRGVEILDSRQELRSLLRDNDYYRLPTIYHGFVKKAAIKRVEERQGRFFLSAIVDVYASIALAMDAIPLAFSRSPLLINGGSARSNGASHLGGASSAEKESWQVEDDLGFLAGFEGFRTVGSLIVESALRYCSAMPETQLSDIFDMGDVRQALLQEREVRRHDGRPDEDSGPMFAAAGLSVSDRETQLPVGRARRYAKLVKSFLESRPIDMEAHGATDVMGAAQRLTEFTQAGRTGIFDHPIEQARTALRLGRH